MFDFSKEDVNGNNSNISIFNNGEAGVVKNVTINVEKLGVEYENVEGKKLPHYRLVFTDSNGGKTNEGFYYLDKETHNPQYREFDEEVKRQWRKLAHIVEQAGGEPIQSGENAKALLDVMAKQVKEITNGKTFNVFANYGHANNPKKYIQVRTWIPFVELSDNAESILKKTNIDQIERLVPDSETSTSGGTTSGGWTE